VTYRTSEDFAEETSPFRRLVRGMVRHVTISLTQSSLWQVVGQKGGSGGTETFEAPPLTGIGVYARPPASGNPEGIALAIAGSKSTMIVAMRDEATRQAIAGDLAEDETAIFNSQALMLVKANGTIEVGAGPDVESTLKGSTYRSSEDTMLSALSTFATALGAYALAIKAVADPSNAATPTFTAAVATVKAAIATFQGSAASYLTTIAKVR
jgi:hypothetical protein